MSRESEVPATADVLPPGMRLARTPEPQVLVIFGASGDLTRRKLMPALFRLHAAGLLPEHFAVLGVGRTPLSDAEFQEQMRDALAEFAEAPSAEAWNGFCELLTYLPLALENVGDYRQLGDGLAELDRERETGGNRLFYLAIPPGVFDEVVEGLGRAGLAGNWNGGWSRIVVEKPFGRDLQSARVLNETLLRVFDEPQIFRIDHYLGKETTQNLLIFRFANVIWEPVWNRNYVDHVQITVAESDGVGTRAGYYDSAGALRDMIQSHLLQLLALVAMEPPAAYTADGIRNEKEKVLCAIRPVYPEDVPSETARGRYSAGKLDGRTVTGYIQEEGVAEDSHTETFAAMRLFIDNWRWADVPFYLRTGKRLPEKKTDIVIRFRSAPHPVIDPQECDRPQPNVLVLRIQPEEGISLFFEAKVPGLSGPLRPVSMDFGYSQAFGVASPEAYERLLLDAMLGDATLFARRDEVEAAWELVTPILRAWEKSSETPEPYEAGSWGPRSADTLIGPEREWRMP